MQVFETSLARKCQDGKNDMVTAMNRRLEYFLLYIYIPRANSSSEK